MLEWIIDFLISSVSVSSPDAPKGCVWCLLGFVILAVLVVLGILIYSCTL